MISYNLIVFSIIINLIILGLLLFKSYRMDIFKKRQEKFDLYFNSIDPRTVIGKKVIIAIKKYLQDINQKIKTETR